MPTESSDLQQYVEGADGIFVIRGSPIARAWNGIQYKIGMSSKNVPAKQLSMNVAMIPPGAVAYAHVHVGFEVMLYILQGRVRHQYGEGLKQSVDNAAGDFIYIEPGIPHEVFNLSDTEPVVAVVARSDAEEWHISSPTTVPQDDSATSWTRKARHASQGITRVYTWRREPLCITCRASPRGNALRLSTFGGASCG
jgi:uncharacterized RmlC-like cupin family protein